MNKVHIFVVVTMLLLILISLLFFWPKVVAKTRSMMQPAVTSVHKPADHASKR